MRHLPRITSSIAVAAVLAACAPADEAPAVDDETTVDTAVAAPDVEQSPAPNATIQLSLQNGQIVVEPDSLEVERGAMVRWAGGEEAVWVVAFAGGTPFRNGRRVFNGGGPSSAGQGPINQDAPTTTYKYWVFYPDGQGGYLQLDPKLVVIEDEGTGGSDSLSTD